MNVTSYELSVIRSIIDKLNLIGIETISLGDTELMDSNGDVLGYLVFDGDAMEYVYSNTKPQ